MLGRSWKLAVGIPLTLLAAACTGSPSPTTAPPVTSTSVAPTTSTDAPPPVAGPADLVVYPDPVAPGGRLELCADTVQPGAFEFVISTDGARGVASVRTSQRGVAATCWEAAVPGELVRTDDGQAADVPIVPGTYEVAVVGDGVVVAAGTITVAEPSESTPWVGDPLLVGLPVPVAVSNAHAAGGDVIVHGGLQGVVDVALPATIDAPLDGAPVHLWVDPDAAPAEHPYDLVSIAGVTWLSRDPRFDGGHRPLVDMAATTGEAPAMSVAEELAWPLMGREPIAYLRSESATGTTDLWAYEPGSGNVWTLTIFPADGPATGDWEYEPLHGGPFVGLSASDGVRAIRLGVDPILPSGDEGYPEELPPLEVNENDLGDVIVEMLAAWETLPGGVEAALSPDGIHRTFLRSVIRRADARLFGPFVAADEVGDVPPGPNQQPVAVPGSAEVRVTFLPAVEAAARLGADASVDLDGPRALFLDDRGVWWFCLDTGFSLPADVDLDVAVQMAAEVCRLPQFVRPVG